MTFCDFRLFCGSTSGLDYCDRRGEGKRFLKGNIFRGGSLLRWGRGGKEEGNCG